MLPFRGSARAKAVIDLSSHLAGSPNESASRVNIALDGFSEPVLWVAKLWEDGVRRQVHGFAR